MQTIKTCTHIATNVDPFNGNSIHYESDSPIVIAKMYVCMHCIHLLITHFYLLFSSATKFIGKLWPLDKNDAAHTVTDSFIYNSTDLMNQKSNRLKKERTKEKQRWKERWEKMSLFYLMLIWYFICNVIAFDKDLHAVEMHLAEVNDKLLSIDHRSPHTNVHFWDAWAINRHRHTP